MVSTQATGDARVNIRSNTTLNVGGDLYEIVHVITM
jgi:hypothetical protein